MNDFTSGDNNSSSNSSNASIPMAQHVRGGPTTSSRSSSSSTFTNISSGTKTQDLPLSPPKKIIKRLTPVNSPSKKFSYDKDAKLHEDRRKLKEQSKLARLKIHTEKVYKINENIKNEQEIRKQKVLEKSVVKETNAKLNKEKINEQRREKAKEFIEKFELKKREMGRRAFIFVFPKDQVDKVDQVDKEIEGPGTISSSPPTIGKNDSFSLSSYADKVPPEKKKLLASNNKSLSIIAKAVKFNILNKKIDVIKSTVIFRHPLLGMTQVRTASITEFHALLNKELESAISYVFQYLGLHKSMLWNDARLFLQCFYVLWEKSLHKGKSRIKCGLDTKLGNFDYTEVDGIDEEYFEKYKNDEFSERLIQFLYVRAFNLILAFKVLIFSANVDDIRNPISVKRLKLCKAWRQYVLAYMNFSENHLSRSIIILMFNMSKLRNGRELLIERAKEPDVQFIAKDLIKDIEEYTSRIEYFDQQVSKFKFQLSNNMLYFNKQKENFKWASGLNYDLEKDLNSFEQLYSKRIIRDQLIVDYHLLPVFCPDLQNWRKYLLINEIDEALIKQENNSLSFAKTGISAGHSRRIRKRFLKHSIHRSIDPGPDEHKNHYKRLCSVFPQYKNHSRTIAALRKEAVENHSVNGLRLFYLQLFAQVILCFDPELKDADISILKLDPFDFRKATMCMLSLAEKAGLEFPVNSKLQIKKLEHKAARMDVEEVLENKGNILDDILCCFEKAITFSINRSLDYYITLHTKISAADFESYHFCRYHAISENDHILIEGHFSLLLEFLTRQVIDKVVLKDEVTFSLWLVATFLTSESYNDASIISSNFQIIEILQIFRAHCISIMTRVSAVVASSSIMYLLSSYYRGIHLKIPHDIDVTIKDENLSLYQIIDAEKLSKKLCENYDDISSFNFVQNRIAILTLIKLHFTDQIIEKFDKLFEIKNTKSKSSYSNSMFIRKIIEFNFENDENRKTLENLVDLAIAKKYISGNAKGKSGGKMMISTRDKGKNIRSVLRKQIRYFLINSIDPISFEDTADNGRPIDSGMRKLYESELNEILVLFKKLQSLNFECYGSNVYKTILAYLRRGSIGYES